MGEYYQSARLLTLTHARSASRLITLASRRSHFIVVAVVGGDHRIFHLNDALIESVEVK